MQIRWLVDPTLLTKCVTSQTMEARNNSTWGPKDFGGPEEEFYGIKSVIYAPIHANFLRLTLKKNHENVTNFITIKQGIHGEKDWH